VLDESYEAWTHEVRPLSDTCQVGWILWSIDTWNESYVQHVSHTNTSITLSQHTLGDLAPRVKAYYRRL